MSTFLLLAALVTQTCEIARGWGAYLFEVTPDDPDPEVVFAGTAVTKAFCYLPDALNATRSYDSEGRPLMTDVDGNTVQGTAVSYRQWVRSTPGLVDLQSMATDLRNIIGGFVYVVFATNKTEVTLTGDPALPHFHWRVADQKGGVASLAAPSLDAKVTKPLREYFAESPCNVMAKSGSYFQNVYFFTGIQTAPVASPFKATKSILAGEAYGFTATKESDWPGVVDVRGVGTSGLHFGADETLLSFQLRNAGTTNRVISLKYDAKDSERVPLTEFDATNTLYYTLAAGDAVTVTLHCDPTERAENNVCTTNRYRGVLTARDVTGGTDMRVRFPVKADSVPRGVQWPSGFYVGAFALDAVCRDGESAATTAGGVMKGTLLLRIDEGGTPEMLQRLAIGQVDGVTAVYPDLTDETNLTTRATLRRVSSATMDPDNRIVRSATPLSDVNKEAVFGWSLAATSPNNPYYHPLHPDHDGLVFNSDGRVVRAPDGDDATKYLNATKPELFSVSNSVTLAFETLKWTGEDKLEGTVTWEIFGLRKMISDPLARGVRCTGTFRLERVTGNCGYASSGNAN